MEVGLPVTTSEEWPFRFVIRTLSIPGGEETCILCRTAVRKEKEQAIRERFTARMERVLNALEQTQAGALAFPHTSRTPAAVWRRETRNQTAWVG